MPTIYFQKPGTSRPPYSRVFVSYVHEREDELVVEALCRELTKHGINVFRDRDSLTPGHPWASELAQAIRSGSCFLACFSARYSGRTSTYMDEEIAVALRELRSRRLAAGWFVPVRLDNTPLPDIAVDQTSSIRDLQWVDLFPSLRDGVDQLLRIIRPPSLAPPEFEDLLRSLCTAHIDSRIARFTSGRLLRIRELEVRWRGLLMPQLWNSTVEAAFQAFQLARDADAPQTEHVREGAEPERHVVITVAPGFDAKPVLEHLDPGGAPTLFTRIRDHCRPSVVHGVRLVRVPAHPYSRFLRNAKIANRQSVGWQHRDLVHWIIRFDKVETGVDLLYLPSIDFDTKCLALEMHQAKGTLSGPGTYGRIYPSSLVSGETMSQTMRALSQQEVLAQRYPAS